MNENFLVVVALLTSIVAIMFSNPHIATGAIVLSTGAIVITSIKREIAKHIAK